MEIEVRIDSSRREPKVVIFTDRMTEEVDAIVKRPVSYTHLDVYKRQILVMPGWVLTSPCGGSMLPPPSITSI